MSKIIYRTGPLSMRCRRLPWRVTYPASLPAVALLRSTVSIRTRAAMFFAESIHFYARQQIALYGAVRAPS